MLRNTSTIWCGITNRIVLTRAARGINRSVLTGAGCGGRWRLACCCATCWNFMQGLLIILTDGYAIGDV